MNKKGMIFNIFLVLFTLFMLTYAYIGIQGKYDSTVIDGPFDVLKLYQQGEASLEYVDKSAKLSLEQTIYDLGVHGGDFNGSQCETYLGDAVWRDSNNQHCFPDYNESIKRYVQFILINI